MQTFRTFDHEQEARDYRYKNGTGGWIFVPDDKRINVVLFPPDMSPTNILRHPFARGKSGQLIGSM